MSNCSDKICNDSCAHIFMDISQYKAYECFDEFNRITFNVLNVVSTQVKTV